VCAFVKITEMWRGKNINVIHSGNVDRNQNTLISILSNIGVGKWTVWNYTEKHCLHKVYYNSETTRNVGYWMYPNHNNVTKQ
jgi:flavin-dependent dehydrogenase